jgi:hypothetical protein
MVWRVGLVEPRELVSRAGLIPPLLYYMWRLRPASLPFRHPSEAMLSQHHYLHGLLFWVARKALCDPTF